MKRVRITIDPRAIEVPPIADLLTGGADYLDRVEQVNWNVSDPPAGLLLRLRGDYRRFEEVLASEEYVTDHEMLPVTDEECYCFLQGEVTAATRALFENFTRGSLMTVPPVEYNHDGSSTFTLVGTEDDIQAAVDGVPDGVDVTVEAVGGGRVTPESAVGSLSPRQREAVETALDVGYYDVPRAATTENVAAEMGCETATAAEHLQKAEATLIAALFDQ